MFDHVCKGRVFYSRTQRKYKVQDVTEKGFTISRESGGTDQKITWAMVQKTLGRLKNGEQLEYQANASQGGISYTVAVETGVLFALKDVILCDDKRRKITLKEGS